MFLLYFPMACETYPSLLRYSGRRVKFVKRPLGSWLPSTHVCLPVWIG